MHHPLAIIQHQYVISPTIPELKEYREKNGQQVPVLRSLEGSYYIRQERDGMLVGPYEPRDVMQLQDEWSKTTVCNTMNKLRNFRSWELRFC